MYKREQTLSYAVALQSIHLFSPLLKGDQFHAYLTAQAQNAFPRIFVFLSIHVFLPLLKGDQFHAYLTAQKQNAVPRIFFF